MSINTTMTAIADAIREKTGGTDKLTLDDMALAVDEVYKAGQDSAGVEIDPDKILPTTVTGDGFVHLDDVSEIQHDITIEAAEGTKVSVYGKNLFDDVSFYESNGFTKEADGWKGHSLSKEIWKNTNQIKGALTLSMWTKKEDSRVVITVIHYTDGTYSYSGEITGNHQDWTQFTYVTDAEKTVDRINYSYGAQGTYLVKNTQIAVGSTSYYSPYVEQVEVIAPATIKSNPFYMNFISNSFLTIGYNKSWGMNEKSKRIWDTIQEQGKRYWYSYAFAWWGDDSEYTPTYPIKSAYIYGAFANSRITNTKVPISVYSGSENSYKTAGNAFANCKELITIPSLDITHANNLANTFANCNKLVNLTMVGEIKIGGLDLHWSTKLSKESIISIVNALKDDKDVEVTLSQTAVNNAFPNYSEWEELIFYKPNVTFNLI